MMKASCHSTSMGLDNMYLDGSCVFVRTIRSPPLVWRNIIQFMLPHWCLVESVFLVSIDGVDDVVPECPLSMHGSCGFSAKKALCGSLRRRMRCMISFIEGHGPSVECPVEFLFCGSSRDVLVSEGKVERFGMKLALKIWVVQESPDPNRSESKYLRTASRRGFAHCPVTFAYLEELVVGVDRCSVLLVEAITTSVDLVMLQLQWVPFNATSFLYVREIVLKTVAMLVSCFKFHQQVLDCPHSANIGVNMDWLEFSKTPVADISVYHLDLVYSGQRDRQERDLNRAIERFLSDGELQLADLRVVGLNGDVVPLDQWLAVAHELAQSTKLSYRGWELIWADLVDIFHALELRFEL